MTSNDPSKQKGINQQHTGLSLQTNRVSPGLLSRAQVAQRLGVCSHTIQRLTRRGLLPAIVFNRRLIRYAPEVVARFIEAATTGGTQ